MAHKIDIQVGARVRAVRTAAGMTQQNLAEALGITFQQIQKYEHGSNRISCSRLWEIAHVLDVPVVELFGYSADTNGGCSALQREALTLVKNFKRIKSDQHRAKICALVKSIAGVQEAGK